MKNYLKTKVLLINNQKKLNLLKIRIRIEVHFIFKMSYKFHNNQMNIKIMIKLELFQRIQMQVKEKK